MAKYLVNRTEKNIAEIRAKGDHRDSRKAAWFAIKKGGEVIRDIQRQAQRHEDWKRLEDALPSVSDEAKAILKMRIEAIDRLKRAPHHAQGFRPSRYTRQENPRPVTALCLVSGFEGQEIPGLVRYDRVLVDAEHMEQALGPATVNEIFEIRKKIGEHVYISTNVSESPQIVRNSQTGGVDTRATAALTASKVIAALEAGADVVKVGFANLDITKRDLHKDEVICQMKMVRKYLDEAVEAKAMVMSLNRQGRFPLISVFFPEMGIDSNGERPFEIAAKGIDITKAGGWQGMLIDTYEKFTGKKYKDFFTLEDTAKLAKQAHQAGLEFWIAGSISCDEVADLVKCKVDLICFGGAARHRTAVRVTDEKGKRDESIKRDLVEELVQAFELADPRER